MDLFFFDTSVIFRATPHKCHNPHYPIGAELFIEPIKWQMLIHLLMITGCRRGEIVGLKWDRVNWADSSIRIDTTLLYTSDRGVYESTTKTGADRTIKLPKETMELLRQYKVWQLETRLAMGDRWKDTPYVFTGECGGCMAPDTLSG